MEKKIMLGNEAIARGAWEAGVKVSSAYPGTPSTEMSENLVKYEGVYAEWAPNEKVALETAFGASLAGKRSYCAININSCSQTCKSGYLSLPLPRINHQSIENGVP